MNFRRELAQAVLDGTKTETRRVVSDDPRSHWWRGECFYKPDRNYAVCPGRGKEQVGRLRVLEVRKDRLGNVGYAEARREGFDSLVQFGLTWEALHGSFDTELEVWVVRFERFHRYTVVTGYFNDKTPADSLEEVRAIVKAFLDSRRATGACRSWWVVDNSDPSGHARVPVEDVT